MYICIYVHVYIFIYLYEPPSEPQSAGRTETPTAPALTTSVVEGSCSRILSAYPFVCENGYANSVSNDYTIRTTARADTGTVLPHTNSTIKERERERERGKLLSHLVCIPLRLCKGEASQQ